MNFIRNGFNFFFIVLISNTFQADSKLKFKYPTSITLANKNIFVIEENGIYICDPEFTEIKKTIKSFNTEEEKISTLDKLSTIILIKRDDYLISLINYKVFFFSPNGDFLYNSDKVIEDYNPTSISLTPIRIIYKSNVITYVVSYFDSDIKLNLLYYKYDIYYKRSDFISKTTEDNLKKRKCYSSCYYDSMDYHFNFKNKGLSCVYMKDSYNYYSNDYFYIVCFFIAESSNYEYLQEMVFTIENNEIKLTAKFSHDYISFNILII